MGVWEVGVNFTWWSRNCLNLLGWIPASSKAKWWLNLVGLCLRLDNSQCHDVLGVILLKHKSCCVAAQWESWGPPGEAVHAFILSFSYSRPRFPWRKPSIPAGASPSRRHSTTPCRGSPVVSGCGSTSPSLCVRGVTGKLSRGDGWQQTCSGLGGRRWWRTHTQGYASLRAPHHMHASFVFEFLWLQCFSRGEGASTLSPVGSS